MAQEVRFVDPFPKASYISVMWVIYLYSALGFCLEDDRASIPCSK
jgi:hypothetical protein